MTDKQSKSDKTPEQRPPGPPKTVWREYFESIIVTVLMFLFFITFIGRTVAVPTGSMQNTIMIGDHFLINKFIFAPGPSLPFLPQREIRRGDIVVFKYPGDRDHPGEDARAHVTPYQDYYIKRVIGLPGDLVEVRGANVYINEQVLPEHRVAAKQGEPPNKAPLVILDVPPKHGEPYTVYYSPDTLAAHGDVAVDTNYFKYGVGKPVRVPDDSYFMMGDNRDNSADSRVWGFVRRDLIIGRALFVFWSRDESAPAGFPLFDFFRNTRWNRTFTWIK